MGAISLGFGALVLLGFVQVLARTRLQSTPPVITALTLLLGAAVGVYVWGRARRR